MSFHIPEGNSFESSLARSCLQATIQEFQNGNPEALKLLGTACRLLGFQTTITLILDLPVKSEAIFPSETQYPQK